MKRVRYTERQLGWLWSIIWANVAIGFLDTWLILVNT